MLKVIMFDFDGVIADTFRLNLNVFRSLYPEVTEQQYRDHGNGNPYEEPTIKITPEDRIIWNQRELKAFTANDFFPLKDVVSKLARKYILLIVTAKTEDSIEDHLKLGGYSTYFKKVYGFETSKSKVEKFNTAMNDFNFNADECVYVTDTIGDIKEAHKAGVPVIAVTWGYHDRKLLASVKPVAIVDTGDELFNEISKIASV